MADVAVISKYGNLGVSSGEVAELYGYLTGDEAYFIEAEGRNCEATAIGLITPDAAAHLGYMTERDSAICDFLAQLVDDEVDTGNYTFDGLDIHYIA